MKRTALRRIALFALCGPLLLSCQAAQSGEVLSRHRELDARFAVTSVALSPDGSKLALQTMVDASVQVWDVEQAKLQASLSRSSAVSLGRLKQDILFTPDGRYLVAVDSPGPTRPGAPSEKETLHARIWDVATAREVGLIRGASEGRIGICWSRALDAVVVATRNRLAWFGLPKGEPLGSLEVDDSLDDKSLRYTVNTASCHPQLPQVAVSPQGEPRPPLTPLKRTLQSSTPILIFDLAAKRRIGMITFHATDTIVRYEPDGKFLLTFPLNWDQPRDQPAGVHYSEAVTVWDARSFQEAGVVETPMILYYKATQKARATLVWPRPLSAFPGFAAHDERELQIWNYATGGIVARVPMQDLSALAVSDDGRWIATGNGSKARVLRLQLPDRR